MNWIIIGHIADILGIVSCVFSFRILHRVYAKTESQKETYRNERKELLIHLRAIQQNIWDDGLISIEIQDTLQTKMFEYQLKYLFISSPRCIFHAFRLSLIHI